LLDSLVFRKTNAAVVVVSSSISEKEIMPFIEELVSVIQTHLSESIL